MISLGGGTGTPVDGEVILWNYETGIAVMSFPEWAGGRMPPPFIPDGKQLAVSRQAGKVHIWTVP